MSSQNPRAYTFDAIYLGDCAPASGILSRIPDLRTNGVVINDITPTERIPWLNITCLTGNRVVTVETQYYDSSSSDLVDLAAKGISLTGSLNSPSSLQNYSLFLLSPETEGKDNFYFPIVRTKIEYTKAFKKDGGIVVPVTFLIEANDLISNLYNCGTADELDTLMGIRSPI